jgi:hypothetical protein
VTSKFMIMIMLMKMIINMMMIMRMMTLMMMMMLVRTFRCYSVDEVVPLSSSSLSIYLCISIITITIIIAIFLSFYRHVRCSCDYYWSRQDGSSPADSSPDTR